MSQIVQLLMNLIKEFQTEANILIVVIGIIVIGFFCFSEERRKKLPVTIFFTVLGIILVLSAVNLGAEYANKLKF